MAMQIKIHLYQHTEITSIIAAELNAPLAAMLMPILS